ncbi:TetR/AcrR family transcriptional regulator [Agrococcus sp. SGAir0287]|uniref:TetR/AcrR family transcriptional regulator n=1 Tax=Agrococcus sp. SGAir0287 TaxID=2070347 RepID=UPI0010CCF224|nr:TetR/AcrR family transcriptional regulator [Agrococcus sp. SGAir0287]QCR20129.1 TetR/AcrR family transcriptional regulator [Agrococcus sp. SGAir0287]
MAMRTSTRERILDAADELFAVRGIAATPVDAVLERARVSSATLYRGFASKEALLAAVLERRHEEWLATWDAAVDDASDPEGRLLAVFDALDAFRDRPRGSRWCAFLGAAAEYADAPAEVARAVQADTDALRDRLARLAADAGVDDADAFAERLLLVVTGDLAMRLREPGRTTRTARAVAEALLAQARTLA